jgi:hypothetical protein
MPLFLDIYFIYSYRYNISVGVCLWFCRLDVVLKLGCIGAACIDVIVLGFKSVEELYPSPSLGVDSADTSQLPMPKEKNLNGQFQYCHSPHCTLQNFSQIISFVIKSKINLDYYS